MGHEAGETSVDLTIRVVAVANQKGGVGKTTTAVNLAAALVESGHQVLLIDLDPQANASLAAGHSRDTGPTAYDCLLGKESLADCVQNTCWPGLELLPASVDMAAAEIELVQSDDRESLLAMEVEQYIAGGHCLDFVVIDTPPSLGLLTVNALVAADELVVPVQPEFYAIDGLGQLARTVGLIRSALKPALRFSLLCLTMFDERVSAHQHVADELRAHLGSLVAKRAVARDEILSTAPASGVPAMWAWPHSTGADSYRAIAREFIEIAREGGTE